MAFIVLARMKQKVKHAVQNNVFAFPYAALCIRYLARSTSNPLPSFQEAFVGTYVPIPKRQGNTNICMQLVSKMQCWYMYLRRSFDWQYMYRNRRRIWIRLLYVVCFPFVFKCSVKIKHEKEAILKSITVILRK